MSGRCYRGEGCQGREQGALVFRPGARRDPFMCPAGSAVFLTPRPGDLQGCGHVPLLGGVETLHWPRGSCTGT